MNTVSISTLEELSAFAKKVLETTSASTKATVLALQGDLGAGKTAFTKELAMCLGIQNDITSPTFVIMKSYRIPSHALFKNLVHIDAYRIEKENEMHILGFEKLLLHPENLIVIEWPERIENLIPEDANRFTFTLQGTTRTITYGN